MRYIRPGKIWAVHMDFDNPPNGSLFIKSINGEQAVENKLTVQTPPHGKIISMNQFSKPRK